MNDFKQVSKLLLSNLEVLEEELSEITDANKLQFMHSGSNKIKQHADLSKKKSLIEESKNFIDLKKIKHAIIQIDDKKST